MTHLNTFCTETQDYTIPADIMLKSPVLYNSMNNTTQNILYFTVHVEKVALQSVLPTPFKMVV